MYERVVTEGWCGQSTVVKHPSRASVQQIHHWVAEWPLVARVGPSRAGAAGGVGNLLTALGG